MLTSMRKVFQEHHVYVCGWSSMRGVLSLHSLRHYLEMFEPTQCHEQPAAYGEILELHS